MFLSATVGDVNRSFDETTTKTVCPTSFVFVLLLYKERPKGVADENVPDENENVFVFVFVFRVRNGLREDMS